MIALLLCTITLEFFSIYVCMYQSVPHDDESAYTISTKRLHLKPTLNHTTKMSQFIGPDAQGSDMVNAFPDQVKKKTCASRPTSNKQSN